MPLQVQFRMRPKFPSLFPEREQGYFVFHLALKQWRLPDVKVSHRAAKATPKLQVSFQAIDTVNENEPAVMWAKAEFLTLSFEHPSESSKYRNSSAWA